MEKLVIPNCNVLEFLKDCNLDHLEEIAIIYEGKEITYNEIFKIADQFALAIKKYGIREEEIVTVWLPNTPELLGLFLGLCSVNVIPSFVDPRMNIEQLENDIKTTKSRMLFSTTLKHFDDMVMQLVNKDSLETVVKVSPAEQFKLFGRILISFSDAITSIKNSPTQFLKSELKKKLIKIKNTLKIVGRVKFINYSKFMSISKKRKLQFYSSPIDTKGGLLIRTSGTSKGNISSGKLIKLTQKNAIALCLQHQIARDSGKLNIKRGDKVLCFAPFSLAYGVLDACVMPMSMGVQLIMIPNYVQEEISDYFIKYHPEHVLGFPTCADQLMSDPRMKNEDLSYIKTFVLGAEKYELNKQRIFNSWLHEHGVNSDVVVTPGYGKNELSSVLLYAMDKPESVKDPCPTLQGYYVGMPLAGNKVEIFNEEKTAILPAGEVGLICACTPTAMECYYDDVQLTEKSFFYYNGIKYHDTEDYGYRDDSSHFFYLGRNGQQIRTSDGQKIPYMVVEGIIKQLIEVRECKLTSNEGKTVAHVVLEDKQDINIELLLQNLTRTLKNGLDEKFRPYAINFIDKIPMTGNGKENFFELSQKKIDNMIIMDYNGVKIKKIKV